MRKRIIGIVLTLVLCLSLLPATALAEDGGSVQQGHKIERVLNQGIELYLTVGDEENATGYEFAAAGQMVTVRANPTTATLIFETESGTVFAANSIKEGVYTFTMPDEDVYIKASFTGHALHDVQHHACGNETCVGHPLPPSPENQEDKFTHGGNEPEKYNVLVSMDNYELTSGAYYLAGNLKVTSTLVIPQSTTVNLCLNDCTLSLADGHTGPLFKIESGGTLAICDCGDAKGSLTGSNTNGNENNVGSSVITVEELGVLELYSGTISGNSAENGSGVYLNGGTFNMYGGTISGNSAENGGGVYVGTKVGGRHGTFNMYGGTISGNSAENGGGVYVNGGGVNMYGGTISGNEAETGGGGVYILAIEGPTSQFIMQCGAISDNKAKNGGGVFAAGGNFMMQGGTIGGNSAENGGGGVHVADGIFSMDAGTISDNEAETGGGVAVVGGSFNLGDAAIQGNSAENGGGVYVNNDTTTSFTVYGGSISGNKKGSDNNAGPTNVYVEGDAPFTVGENLGTETSIYVDHGIGAVFTNAAVSEDEMEHFASSDSNLKVGRTSDGALKIELDENASLPAHIHEEGTQTADEYSPLTSGSLAENTGNYYLYTNLQTETAITINGVVNLCLNGHDLTLKSGAEGPLFKIEEGSALTLCDCKGSGKIVGAVSSAGKLYIYGGTASEIALEGSGAVYLADSAKFAGNELKVTFTGSNQIFADPALMSSQKIKLHLNGSNVPSGAVVTAWKAGADNVKFASMDNFTLEQPETGYILELQNEGSTVALKKIGNSGDNSDGNSGSGGNIYIPPVQKVTVPISGEDNTIYVGVRVTSGKAVIDNDEIRRLDTVIGDSVENVGTVTIDFSALKKEINAVEIPAETVKIIAEAANNPHNDAKSFKIVLPDGTSIEFDAKTLAEKAAQASGEVITIKIAQAKTEELSHSQKEAVGDRVAYEISVLSGGKQLSGISGTITVQVPYELKLGEKAEGIVVYYVDDEGNREHCETNYDADMKCVNWQTHHLSVYMIDYEEKTEAEILQEKLDGIQLVARSKMSTLNGKKAIQIFWYDENGAKLDDIFDGYEVKRSTMRFSGYGKEPYFETTKTSYKNNKELKAGTTYYYKVRGYVELDGKKYYSDWSRKAWRAF